MICFVNCYKYRYIYIYLGVLFVFNIEYRWLIDIVSLIFVIVYNIIGL